jgi:hypothetical protein
MEPKMNEEGLKRRAEKRRPAITEAWAYLEKKGYVGEALEKPFDEDMVEYIIKEFDDLPEKAQRGGSSRRQAMVQSGGRDTVQVPLGEVELEHQAALEEYLAMCAACDVDVYRFREKVLEGHLLAEDQARELLKSPAAALMETRLFKGWKVPIVGHTAEVKSYESELVHQGTSYVATLAVHPPGITREVRMVPWPGASHADKQRPVVLEFPDEEGRIVGRRVWSISLLGELKGVGEKLSERYRWHPAQAVWFVLTGEIPAVPALTVIRSFPSSMYHYDTLITVEASPWVSSRTVERAFRKAQIKTLESGGGRPLGKKNLKLLRFVIERMEPLGMLEDGKRPSRAPEGMAELELVTQLWYMKAPKGKELVSEWNETYPQWSYGDDTRRFWRDYNRTKKSVAFGPPYQ